MKTSMTAVAGCFLALTACSDAENDDALPTTPPTSVSRLALELDETTRFTEPDDGVVSPDGATFYFSARTTRDDQPALFAVPAEGGVVRRLHAGAPLEAPTGLLMSCDGDSVFVADFGQTMGDDEDAGGAIYRLPLDGGALQPLDIEGVGRPVRLAMGPDCETLHVTGYTPEEEPALFRVPLDGGAATVTHVGAPLVSPSGVHVDGDDLAWVMDTLGVGEEAGGALFAITLEGEVTPVLENIRISRPAGVSLAAGGVTAVIPMLDESGRTRLVSVDTGTGEQSVLETPEVRRPTGIKTAREAGVFVVVDHEGDAIFRAR